MTGTERRQHARSAVRRGGAAALAAAVPSRALRGLLCATALTASLLCAATPGHATPPPNPSDAQLDAARAAKASLANTVGVLSGQIVQAQAQLRSLSAQVELAEQKFTYAIFKLDQAKTQAAQAQAAVATAQQGIETARANLTNFVHDSYVSPSLGSATVGLLSATDPNALLQSGDYRNYVSSRQLDAMSSLDRAIVAKSNADAKAKSLLALQAEAGRRGRRRAEGRPAGLRRPAGPWPAQLRAREASYQRQLADAQSQLATLNGQRAKYIAYQQEQARIAAERARQAALARQRAEEAAARARAEAERQRQQQQQQQSNHNSGGGNSGGVTAAAAAVAVATPRHRRPAGPAAGRPARAERRPTARWAGWAPRTPGPAATTAARPGAWTRPAPTARTTARCSASTAPAWPCTPGHPRGSPGPLRGLAVLVPARSTRSPASSCPATCCSGPTAALDAIHHVAIYIGNGNVVQAPHSGDVVRVTPWDQVSWGYFGATRPLT